MHGFEVIRKDCLKNKKVLVRVDFNVPIENGTIRDDSRINNALPTIEFLKRAGAKIILISHLGKTSHFNQNQSLRNIAEEVEKKYSSRVVFIDDCLCENAAPIISDSSIDDIILMENLRFHPEEEECDLAFARRLANLADFYINEAFSASHRKHASIFAVPQFLPHALGLSFVKEIQTIDGFFSNAISPKMCIVGGVKLSTKINLLKNLVKKVDKIALGGGIAGIFLSFVRNSSFKILDSEKYGEDIAEILENSKQYGCELILPVDFSTSADGKKVASSALVTSENGESVIFDIGPDSVELFKHHIRESKTIMWNGPIGLFEKPPFDSGTIAIAREISRLTKEGELISITGGGDTSFAMNKFGISQDLSHVSSAGGAFLSYLEGTELPGIAAMRDGYSLQE